MWFWLVVLAWVGAIAAVALNRRLTTGTRGAVYLVGIPAVAYVAAVAAGIGEECPADATDCDLTGLAGMVVGGIVLGVGFVAAIVFEGVRTFLLAAERYEQR